MKRMTFSKQQLDKLRSEYGTIETVNPRHLQKFHTLFDSCSDAALKQLAGADIKFVSSLARNACRRRNINI